MKEFSVYAISKDERQILGHGPGHGQELVCSITPQQGELTMATLLHMSFRVKDPERSAALYAELLNGKTTDPGPVLRPAGVKAVTFGRGQNDPLADYLEFWPQDKHWQGGFTTSDPTRHQPFGHVAFSTDKSYDQLAAIAQKHGVEIRQEERGPFGLVPVVYDYEGNFLEFFSAK